MLLRVFGFFVTRVLWVSQIFIVKRLFGVRVGDEVKLFEHFVIIVTL